MCVIHTLPSLLGEAEELRMTKINAKDKANQTPLSVYLIFLSPHDQKSHAVP